MPSVCLYFQVHQPNRLKPYTFFDLGKDHFYENDQFNAEVIHKVSEKCYLPANRMILDLINQYKGKFKIAYSLSGVFIEQLEYHRPDVLQSFVDLANTGCVEFLGETFYHSLSYFYSKDEFKRQVKLHKKLIEKYFNQKPKVFRNTELTYNNEMAWFLEGMGYEGVITEGVDWHLNGRSSNYFYKAPNAGNIKVMLRNHKLSDDIGFRFSDKTWAEYPLNAEKFASWLSNSEGDVINLFMDYESIGEHQWEDTGIFSFFRELPEKVFNHEHLDFIMPTDAVRKFKSRSIYDVHDPISWADQERNLSAWNGNNLQKEALQMVYGLEKLVKTSRNIDLIHVWSKLQTSDHFYYMSTKVSTDGMVHNYFSPYSSPYDAYIFYMNALSDLEITLNTRNRKKLLALEGISEEVLSDIKPAKESKSGKKKGKGLDTLVASSPKEKKIGGKKAVKE